MQNEATAEKKVTFTQDYNNRRGPSHGSGNWTGRNGDNGAMMSTPRCHLQEGICGQVIRILTTLDKIDLPSEETTRTPTMIDTMTTERDHHTSQTKTNPGVGEVTITIRDRLQRRDKIHLLQILVDKPDQIHITLQCLTGLEIGTLVTIYPTKRNFQLLTLVIT